MAPLEVCHVILGQPYMWKRHAIYESQPHSVIVTLGGQIYQILETVALATFSQGRKIISHSGKFSIFTISSKG